MSKKSKGIKATPSKGSQINGLIKEYQANESVIRSQYQLYTGKKAGLSDSQITELKSLWAYYSDKVFLGIDSYKDLKIRSSFSFMSYVCGLPLPKGIDYSSTEDFCKTNASSYYQEVKARQMRLIRLAELAGHKEKNKSNSSKQETSPLERVTKQVLGSKSTWTDKDRKDLLNSLTSYFKKLASKQAKGKGKDKAEQGQGQGQGQLAA